MGEMRFAPVLQRWRTERMADSEGAAYAAVMASRLAANIRPGMRVAITGGSRGVASIDRVIRGIVSSLKALGAAPFILPAMGTHGNATAEGQRAILADYGITEATVGAPVSPCLESQEIGRIPNRQFGGTIGVYANPLALTADAVVVVNRIKAHTDFHGSTESGLLKMLAIGIGGPDGARSLHSALQPHMIAHIQDSAKQILAVLPPALGIALIENGNAETAQLHRIEGENWQAQEEKLLPISKALGAKLPFDTLDALIVDLMGKNISGTGMDTNVIGRMYIAGMPEPEKPCIKEVAVLDMTPESHGNAAGLGLADITTQRLVDKIDYEATETNIRASLSPLRWRIPAIYQNDRDAIAAACKRAVPQQPEQARVVRIHSTLALGEFLASESLLPELRARPEIELLDEPTPAAFDTEGMLV